MIDDMFINSMVEYISTSTSVPTTHVSKTRESDGPGFICHKPKELSGGSFKTFLPKGKSGCLSF